MNNLLNQYVKPWLAKLQIKRAVAIVLASFFILTSTACSSQEVAKTPNTKAMVDRAERNLQKRADNPQELVDNIQNRNPLGNKARETVKNTKNAAQDTAQDLAQGAKYGSRNLKENLSDAAKATPDVVGQAAKTARSADQDAKQAAKAFGQGAKNVVERTAEAAS